MSLAAATNIVGVATHSRRPIVFLRELIVQGFSDLSSAFSWAIRKGKFQRCTKSGLGDLAARMVEGTQRSQCDKT